MQSKSESVDAAKIDWALAGGHLPSLLMSLAHLTGSTAVLTPERRPDGASLLAAEKALPENVQLAIRTQMRELLIRHFDNGAPALPALPMSDLEMMIRYLIGDQVPSTYIPFLEEEIGVADMRRPDWTSPALAAAAKGMHVVIVGAGMSGLLTAIRLQQAGIDFTILEKNPDVGGTWLENTYPGCRVDSDNQLYSYSFEPNPNWPQHFSTQGVLLGYFQKVADKYDLRRKIKFNVTVRAARFDDAAQDWNIAYRDTDGSEREIRGSAFISAVGQLNVPRAPDINGHASFAGPSFHSARWRHDVDLSGKSVAVIGTGASAFQFVPEIAHQASEVRVFQRTPPWLYPTPHYHHDVSAEQQWLLEHVPYYANWYRFWLYWLTVDGMHAAMKVDPDYPVGPSAVSQANADIRAFLEIWIRGQTGNDAQLAANAVPNYPVGGKRGLRDGGAWISALRRDNVKLVTDPIDHICAEGVVTAGGKLHPADVLIYGTGFRASDFLSSLQVTGSGGVDLQQVWGGDARAYLGTLVPSFPNMFIIYGPNTNLVVNGSIILFAECSVGYVLDCLKLLASSGGKKVEVRQEVYERYNAAVDAANANMAWGSPHVSSWYKNKFGRVSQNWPYPTVDYWSATRSAKPADLLIDGRPATMAAPTQASPEPARR